MTAAQPSCLFAYGTLQHPRIMEHVLGRIPEHRAARLQGFARYRMKGFDFPGIVPESSQETDGTLFLGITPEEWERLDEYEADFYDRLNVTVQTGTTDREACAYVVPPRNHHIISNEPWELNTYQPGPDSGIH